MHGHLTGIMQEVAILADKTTQRSQNRTLNYANFKPVAFAQPLWRGRLQGVVLVNHTQSNDTLSAGSTEIFNQPSTCNHLLKANKSDQSLASYIPSTPQKPQDFQPPTSSGHSRRKTESTPAHRIPPR